MSDFSTETSQPTPQLLFVGEKDKKRLLEVYVKRSISLNDGPRRPEHRSHKWIAVTEKKTRERRHSSDTSLHLTSQASISDEDIRFESLTEQPMDKKEMSSEKKSKKWRIKGSLRRNEGSNASQKSNSKPKKWLQILDKDKEESGPSSDASQAQTNTVIGGDINLKMLDNVELSTVEKKDKESKKTKKPTVWKSFLSWFSKGNTEREQEHQKTEEELPLSQPSTPQISCLPLPDALTKGDINLRHSKSLKKKHRKSFKWRQSGDMSAQKCVEMVEPTHSYYEKMSEEMKKIVHEVKDSPTGVNASNQSTEQTCEKLSQEEVITRLIQLLKQEGDLINEELAGNSIVTSYLDNMSYKCFQQMADQYVQSEVSNKNQPVAAPELVKLAFTLDFTARVANLHRQATGQIMGFGNQYLQDRFTHMSESHPHLTQNSEQEFMSL